ncbi:PucR family transcriptional regulator [Sulfobacillus thermosulfidooxidans]|uniref:PucR family transcriptional regulator n=1 Tax=Sulfobacillus thermosulfidooxidans TaxID=28034 RepID=UPI00096BAFAA|nr:PucR family transcriptional regulator [Sulfobacillus thermosulfidooxidans]OLZ11988.1 hypothetical protein BFX05_05810 [Sulfobacillus thermosulfidooxidans]OLZ16761.1 hypothetical protein BFX06_14785 [Sulfobacillus thermosulfidooxidans]OLZ20691.1 hypothetical protein BFX07_14495 [Sulfobacillus thermosulfidooxidans]
MLTVEQCLHFDVLQKAQVIAGSHGLGRPVQFAHVIEEPDIESWIRPGLAILTTGHPFRDDSIHETWFRELNTHGAACVMVACGRYLATIPPPMIALADDYAIPVIQLPWDVPFVNITAAIHQYLVNEHVKDWTRLTQWQTQLTHAALTARSLDELVHKFSLITRGLVRIVPRSVKTTGPSFIIPQDDLSDMKLSFQMDTKTLAYSDQFTDQLGRHMATVTGLFLLRDQVYRQRQRDARSRFIAQFLRGQSSWPSIIGDDIDPGSFDLEHQYFVIVLSLDDKLTDSKISHVNERIWTAFEKIHGFLTPVPMHNTVVAVFDSHHTSETAIHTQFETVTTKIPQLIGIMSEPVDVTDIATTYQHLLRLLTHATPGSLIPSRSLIYPDIVAKLPADSMKRLLEMTWNQITDADLRQTLVVWLEEAGNTAAILQRLQIHRNTLRNRLNRIQRLLGTPLTSEVAYHLRLAWDWQQVQGPLLAKHPAQ